MLSLGQQGSSSSSSPTHLGVVDGPGVDLLVFENLRELRELGVVAVSEDGLTWSEFPCEATDKAGGYPGCAGVARVLLSPENGISAARSSRGGRR